MFQSTFNVKSILNTDQLEMGLTCGMLHANETKYVENSHLARCKRKLEAEHCPPC